MEKKTSLLFFCFAESILTVNSGPFFFGLFPSLPLLLYRTHYLQSGGRSEG